MPSTRSAHALRALSLSIVSALALAGHAHADDGLVGGQCLKTASGMSNPACTANDVKVARVSVVGTPQSCEPGTQVTINAELQVISSVNRYDIGLWINQAGRSAKTDTTSSCYRNTLQPLAAPINTCNHANTAQTLSYYSLDGDACGDIYANGANPCGNEVKVDCTTGVVTPSGGCVLTRRIVTMAVACSDSNADGNVDTGACASWDINANSVCGGVADAIPGTGSKCRCDDAVSIVGLTLQTIQLNKYIESSSAPGNFDLQIDGTTYAANVSNLMSGIDGTTGPIGVTPGPHPIGEIATAGSGTLLSNYTTSIVCSETVGRCSGNTNVLCNVDATCAAVSAGTCVAASSVVASCNGNCSGFTVTAPSTKSAIVCNITNTYQDPCTGACNDGKSCTADTCNVVNGLPVCSYSNLGLGIACGDPSSTDCNAPDTCDGAGACVDRKDAINTVCRAADGSGCDIDDKCDGTTNACGDVKKAEFASCGSSDATGCNAADSCNAFGACIDRKQAALTACGDSTDTACSNPDTCDAVGTCQPRNEIGGTFCGDAGGACVNQDTCDGAGACTDNGFKSAQTLCGTGTSTGSACDDDAADHCSGSSALCVDVFDAGGTPCGSTTNTECDKPDTCAGGSNTCLVNHVSAQTQCGDAGGACVNQDMCDGSGACTDNGFKSAQTLCNTGLSQGAECDADGADHCSGSSALCVDVFDAGGTPCGSDADSECDNPDTCAGGSSVCLDNNAPAQTHCGDAGGACVNQDMCDGDGACTDKGFKSAQTSCNTGLSQGAECDNDGADHCSGSSAACVDVFDVGGTPCGSGAAGECDAADTCAGGNNTCLDNNAPAQTPCGDAGAACVNQDTCDGDGACTDKGFKSAQTLCNTGLSQGAECDDDGADHCSGSSASCVDVFDAGGTPCGSGATGACDAADTCAGGNNTCLVNHAPVGTHCGDAEAACVYQDTCNAAGACADSGFKPATTLCATGSSSDGDCDDDGKDHCSGQSALCVDAFLGANVVCRDAEGECDVAESCSGASGTCPGDGVALLATACADEGLVCTTDACNGVSKDCQHVEDVDPNCCDSDLDCPAGVCDPEQHRCVICVNDGGIGAVDNGCTTVPNACDTVVPLGPGTACVDCQATGDCTVVGDICDTDNKACVPCIDDTQGDLDDGCANTIINACLTTGLVNDDSASCVDCTIDADCEDDDVCKTLTHTCVECNTNQDCDPGEVCDPGTNTCSACFDNAEPGGIDRGCATIINACDAPVVGGAGPGCVDCQVTADCSVVGDVCNTSTKDCVPCNDSGAGAQDDGCEDTTLNACKGGGTDAGMCVDCTVDGDCAAGDVCKLSNNTCVQCNTDLDCNTGEVCDPETNTCSVCVNDEAPGGVDLGCLEIINACDTTTVGGHGNGCVDCLVTADCSVSGDVCNTTTKDCVPCNDSGAGVQDEGCEHTTLNACKGGGTDNGTCVDCTVDGDCNAGDVCKLSNNTCVECNTNPDCDAGEVCDLATNTCAVCFNDKAAGGVDQGCQTIVNACDTTVVGGEGTACVDCLTTPDCSVAGDVCNSATKTCVPCTDSGPGAQDNGCEDTTNNACNNGGTSNGTCVDCNVDADCQGGKYCKLATFTCVECRSDSDCASGACDLGSNTCVACINSKPAGEVDLGCATVINACDTTVANGVGPGCVDCLTTPDCNTAGDVCDTANKACVPCVDTGPGVQDEGCENTTLNACRGGGTAAGTCVDCTVDGDCASGKHCQLATNTCVDCTKNADCGPNAVCDEALGLCHACIDNASFPGIDEGCNQPKPVCIEQGIISGGGGSQVVACVVCEDDKPLDTDIDEGCTAARNICSNNVAGNACVECNDDSDCDSGEACDVDLGICVACLDDREAGTIDSGCSEVLPVCELGGAGLTDDHCVECENDKGAGLVDWGCDTAEPFCDEGATGGPNCLECETDDDCDPLELCRAGRCIDPGATVAVPDSYTTREGVTLTVGSVALGAIANDQSPPGSTLTAQVTPGSGPTAAEGALTLAPNGTLVFVPATGYAGTVTFMYTLHNALNGASSEAEVTIVVNGAPRAQPDVITTPEDTATTFDPRVNDSDPNGGPLTITGITSAPTHGTATFTATGITYTPAADYNGPDALTYRVCDATDLCTTAVVTVGVTPVNDGPRANDDLVQTPEDTGVLVVVLANDVDIDSASLQVTGIVAEPSHGTVRIGADQAILYEPFANYVGTDAFRYEVCDSDGLCDEAVVLIDVTPVNDPPVAGDDSTTTPGAPVTVAVLANDSDIDGDTLRVTRIVFPPSSGTTRIESDGRITYTPAEDGLFTFSYEVCDASSCDTATVKVLVGSDNRPPTITPDQATTPVSQAVKIDVLANDSDPDEDTLRVTQVGQPSSGSVVINGDGTSTYTPQPGFSGQDSFTYTACDDSGACGVALVTVTVVPGDNRPPIATDDVVSTRREVEVNLTPTDNDVDPDQDPLAVEDITRQPAHGTATLEADGSVTYTPADGFVGTDTFDVSISDGHGGFDTSTVTVVVTADDNLPPLAVDDAYTVPNDRTSELAVLVNDSDPNGDAIVIVDVVQPRQGGVAIIVTGGVTRLVFTPDAGASGTDSFTYTISDGRGGFDEATVTLTYPDGNRPPVAIGESVVTPEDTGVLIIVLANDSDPEGDALVVAGFTVQPRHGAVVIDAGGGVLYVPDPDYNGPDSFTYTACDSEGACASAVVAIAVTPVNDGPRANDDAFSVPAAQSSNLDVIVNDSDPELDLLTVRRIVSQPARGSVVIESDGTVSYQPTATTGTDSFVYEVCDPSGLCDQATVTVYIGDDNGNPTPEDDEASTGAGEAVTIDVLDNDGDPDGDTLTLTLVEDPANGTAVIEDGQVVYTPDLDFVGLEIFFYTVCDAHGACATATVLVDVTPGENTPPVAVDDTVQTTEGTPITFDSTLNDEDVDGDTLTVTSVGDPLHGLVVINPDGTLTYTPDPGYVGEDSFTVTISDGRGGTSTQSVLVEVTSADNLPPDARDDAYDAPSDADTRLPVLVNDVDPDGDTLTIVDVVQPQHGTVAIGEDGTLIFTPDPAYIGRDTFSYTITDGNGGYDTAVVEVWVGDRDRDGLGDGHEVNVTFTDPDDFDSDDDGVGDGIEVSAGDPLVYDEGIDTSPLDADTDDDGLGDGTELRGDGPLDEPTDPLDPDSDGDGVADGVEVGVVVPVAPGTTAESGLPYAGTDTSVWIPDADAAVTTDPRDDDSDDDGIIDGNEDTNGNGKKDGEVGGTGTPGTGETDAANPDTDGDGVQDGTELGISEPQGTGTDLSVFAPDLDPSSTTDPRDTDTDDGGVPDGAEDLNANGYQDPDEIDPNMGGDDTDEPLRMVVEGGGCQGSTFGFLLGMAGLALVVARRRSLT